MDTKKKDLQECSINDIYNGYSETVKYEIPIYPVKYEIPIYQRNYAWGYDEIFALIKDVDDSMNRPSVSQQQPYYIGTLVTYERGDNQYEVIDGQQRLTTIFLILKVLNVHTANTLTYKARQLSADTLTKIEEISDIDNNITVKSFVGEFDMGIVSGLLDAKRAIEKIVGKVNSEATDRFRTYFLNQVKIIHYQVPKDVDLNHYFEVMNSRGEQLEKHEIVKARLCELIKEAPDKVAVFSSVWEASKDMGFYIQQKYRDTSVFGTNNSDFVINEFRELFPVQEQEKNTEVEGEEPKDVNNGKRTIKDLLNTYATDTIDDQHADINDKFQPIVDFSNFLLHVLKITRLIDNNDNDFVVSKFTLDDKMLVERFDEYISYCKKREECEDLVMTFAFNLLKAKYFLDNYIVHHTMDVDRLDKNPWLLQCSTKNNVEGAELTTVFLPTIDDNNKNEKDQEKKTIQAELEHLLSMFEVSFSAKQHKNYLFYCLYQLFRDRNINNYLQFLRGLADKYFFDIYLDENKLNESTKLPKANSFDDTIIKKDRSIYINVDNHPLAKDFDSIYSIGAMDIPLFVFNYTDYKLWKMYAEELRSKNIQEGDEVRNKFFERLGCSDFGLKEFDKFYFSRTRKSLEHYYPQAKAQTISEEEYEKLSSEDKNKLSPPSKEQINCFGNFAMISSEANSSGSNWDPQTKLSHYTDSKGRGVGIGSLKFKIMMRMCKDNEGSRESGQEWLFGDMQKHQINMLNILFGKTEEL